jgi:hypothetical protein
MASLCSGLPRDPVTIGDRLGILNIRASATCSVSRGRRRAHRGYLCLSTSCSCRVDTAQTWGTGQLALHPGEVVLLSAPGPARGPQSAAVACQVIRVDFPHQVPRQVLEAVVLCRALAADHPDKCPGALPMTTGHWPAVINWWNGPHPADPSLAFVRSVLVVGVHPSCGAAIRARAGLVARSRPSSARGTFGGVGASGVRLR